MSEPPLDAAGLAALIRTPGDEAFVNACYARLLRRAPDAGGAAFWIGALREGRATRRNMVDAIVASEEFRALGAPPPLPMDDSSRNLRYDVETTRILERVLDATSNCVDVGCHEGLILDAILEHAPRGWHFAFEPLPHLAEALRAKYRSRPGVAVHALALSDAPGEARFQHVVTNPSYSGLLRRQYDRGDEQVVEIAVRLARMDDVVPAGLPIRLVKIDVEGAELQVLRGAQRVLRESRPYVVFEHGKGAADVYGTRPEHIHQALADCGLRVSLMADWLEAGSSRSLSRDAFAEQFDAELNYYFLAHA